MSSFSDTLSRLIEKKSVKVYDLARYLDMDRSSMYQIVRGKRNPPSEGQIWRISDYMRLSPSEKEELLVAAQITRLGEKIYYQRKGVEQFLCDFPEDLSAFWKNRTDTLESTEGLDVEPDQYVCTFLPTEADVHRCLRQILQRETRKENGSLALLLQPEENFLFDYLRSLDSQKKIRVDHIICLSDADEKADDQTLLYIRYLNTILPLYVRDNVEYTAYYYYDKVQSHFLHNNGFSGMILTGDVGLLVTSDYSRGIVVQQPDVVAGIWGLFRDYKDKCAPLFQVAVVNMRDFTQIQQANDTVTDQKACYILEREVCLLPLLTLDILQGYFLFDIPERDKALMNLADMLCGNREMLESMNMHLYFTREGLEYFAATGRFKELPEEIYVPLGKEAKIQMLSDLRKYCKRGIYKMLAGKLEHLAGNLRLCINGNMGYLMFTEENGRVVYMFLTEPNLLSIFQDYIENLEADIFYADDETVQVIEKICEKM